jgi:hypothetical protein
MRDAEYESQFVLIDTSMAPVKAACVHVPLRRLPLNLMEAQFAREPYN